jgi:hypothetical protein
MMIQTVRYDFLAGSDFLIMIFRTSWPGSWIGPSV